MDVQRFEHNENNEPRGKKLAHLECATAEKKKERTVAAYVETTQKKQPKE